MAYPNPKVHGAIYQGPTSNFSRRDWRELAMACLDQASIAPALYDKIEQMLPDDDDDDDDEQKPEPAADGPTSGAAAGGTIEAVTS